MKIIPPSAFITMPWKNGGGVTHEILRLERNNSLLWRLSVAEVASDGPFSLFPGMSRILTVIEGDGLELTTPGRLLHALPMQPLGFSGDWPITSKRLSGHVRDFNVIFDSKLMFAGIKILVPTEELRLTQQEGLMQAVLFLGTGTANGRDVPSGSLVLAQRTDVNFHCATASLHVTLKEKD